MYRTRSRPASRIVQGESSAHQAQEQGRLRLLCVAVFFGLCFTMLAVRMIEVSMIGGGELPFKRLVSEPHLLFDAQEEHGAVVPVKEEHLPRRDIVDRNGVLLATTVDSASLAANPSLIRNPKEVAKKLSAILPDTDYDKLHKALAKPGSKFTYIARHLAPALQEQVNALGIPGLFFEQTQRRVYPQGEVFSHALGYVDVDNNGIAGIESAFNKELSDDYHAHEPVAVSLDARVQAIVHEELSHAIDYFDALGGVGVVADVRTGELLSMVSMPDFDPHHITARNAQARFNQAAAGVYEMGSTFKPFTVAAALQNRIVKLHEGYDATYPIRIGGFTINDSHGKKRWLSVPEILAYSSNIGTAKMAMDLGKTRQQDFMKNLGLTERMDVELAEQATPLTPSEWRDINTMTVSYGHGISVSPLHLVRAYVALANNGLRVPLTTKLRTEPPKDMQPVMDSDTAEVMHKMLRQVVQFGTGSKADVPGYRVGGKTGTAEKVKAGGYNDTAKMASFVGVFPTDAPRYVVLVMVDEPQGRKETYGYATGGWVAAPTVGNIISRMAPLAGVMPIYQAPDESEVAFWRESEEKNERAKNKRVAARPLPDGGVHATSF